MQIYGFNQQLLRSSDFPASDPSGGLKRLGAYDASGTRVLKGKSNGQAAYVNGEWTGGSGSMLCLPKHRGGRGNYTVYVNPYIVLKSGGYSKRYYIEGQRIVSKLGDGLGDPTNGSKAGNGTVSYGAKQEEAREAIVKNLKFLDQDGSILTAGNSGKTPPGQISTKEKGGGKESEQFQYFYHPDHLGSTSYITDASGEVYQHLEYFAFGETFVEEHSNTDRTPYLFNGKELDEETGLYYYGARYYDPVTSIFPSVDPLTDKYPSISSYAYAFNNPLKYIDPTGMEGEDVTDPPTHEIQKGETLTGIAKQHGTTVGELQSLNNIKNPDKISAGSTLNLPSSNSSAQNAGMINFENSDLALSLGGEIYGVMEGATASQGYWLGKNGKYNSMSWQGNGSTGPRASAVRAAKFYRAAGRVTVGASVILGATMTYQGYVQDGGQFGYNAQKAAASSAGGIAGGIGGAKAGAAFGAGIGVWIGGAGAVPGGVIGGVIGGVLGSLVGSHAGESAVNDYHGR